MDFLVAKHANVVADTCLLPFLVLAALSIFLIFLFVFPTPLFLSCSYLVLAFPLLFKLLFVVVCIACFSFFFLLAWFVRRQWETIIERGTHNSSAKMISKCISNTEIRIGFLREAFAHFDDFQAGFQSTIFQACVSMQKATWICYKFSCACKRKHSQTVLTKASAWLRSCCLQYRWTTKKLRLWAIWIWCQSTECKSHAEEKIGS